MPDAETIGLLATALGFGFVSAVTPFLPVEAYVLVVAATNGRSLGVVVALLAAAGHTAGKMVLFQGTRTAARWPWLTRLRTRAGVGPGVGGPGIADTDVDPSLHACADAPPVTADQEPPPVSGTRPTWRARLRSRLALVTAWLRRANAAALAGLSGRWGPVVVFSAGLLGLPPLLVVVFWAGASSMSLRAFTTACLLGRSVRFTALAVGVSLFAGLSIF